MDKLQAKLLPEDQSTRQNRNRKFIIWTTIFFTILICAIISVFTVLKQQTESESLSANPTAAVQFACRFTRHHSSCVESITSSLANHSHTIQASDILRLSIAAGLRESQTIAAHFHELASNIENKDVVDLDSITSCQRLFVGSVDQLNRSLIMITTVDLDEILASTNDLRDKMVQAENKIENCYYGNAGAVRPTEQRPQSSTEKAMRERIVRAGIYVRNSLAILDNMDAVKEMFDPSVGSVLASLMLVRENYVITVALFCTQYLVLVFLLCSVLRVFV